MSCTEMDCHAPGECDVFDAFDAFDVFDAFEPGASHRKSES